MMVLTLVQFEYNNTNKNFTSVTILLMIGTGHSSGITTTTVATVKDSTGNTRELYILLDTGCSSTMLSDNYLGCVPEF